jgi:hypothetical protein
MCFATPFYFAVASVLVTDGAAAGHGYPKQQFQNSIHSICVMHPNEQRIPLIHLQWKNWWDPIVKILSSYARQVFHTGPMSSAWIMFGSANLKFFSCSESNLRWSRKQTVTSAHAGKCTHVHSSSSQLWRNTLDLSDQVFYLDYLGYLANFLQWGYLVYLGLLMLLLGSLVGQMQLHYLRTPLAIANYVCHTYNFNIG